MRSLSVVCTQMQLVNCIEAIMRYKSENNDLLVLAAPNRIEQIEGLIREYSQYFCFDNIFRFKPSSYSLISTIREFMIIRSTAMKNFYDIVFLSNYKQARQRCLLKKIGLRFDNLKIVLIDDGLAVCEIVKRRNKECVTNTADIHYSTKLNRIMYQLFVGNYIPPKVEYFTVYNNIEIYRKDIIRINEYTFIKNNNLGISPNISRNSVIILGQPLVGSYGMSSFTKESYCSYIKNALNDLEFFSKDIYYFPHPVEDTMVTLSEEILNRIKIQKSKIPFEIIALKLDTSIPVIGFYTSALVNLRESDKSRIITAIYFSEINSSTNHRFKKIVNEAYDYMESIGIKILNKAVI